MNSTEMIFPISGQQGGIRAAMALANGVYKD